MVISIRHVVVNPARTAACVAIAEKFSVYKFSSYSRRMTTITTNAPETRKEMHINAHLFPQLDGGLPQVNF
jgi:hypothetical protein